MIDGEDVVPIESESRRPRFISGRSTKIWFTALIVFQLAMYSLLTLISAQFHFDSPVASRPLPAVLVILAATFVASLLSLVCALKLAGSAKSIVLFFAVAITARGIVLCSEPIQEVDIYRYIWDGAVSGQGISPYRFPPHDVQQAVEEATGRASPELKQRLASLASEQPGLGEVLRRVHFSELPTVYPPVSQAVFRFSNALTPSHADVSIRVRVMKSVILLFDLGVMLLLLILLKLLHMHPGWCIAYGWSPLVIKEFANSGHLDAIAVFLTLASIVCVTLACRLSQSNCEHPSLSPWRSCSFPSPSFSRRVEPKRGEDLRGRPLLADARLSQRESEGKQLGFNDLKTELPPRREAKHRSTIQNDTIPRASGSRATFICTNVLASAILIGLGVGAKLYPIILLPLIACFVDRQLGRRRSIAWLALASITIVVSLAPMATRPAHQVSHIVAEDASTQLQGLKTFLTHWEINDLLFMFVEENIRPEGSVQGQPHLWFAVIPDAWRIKLTSAASILFAGDLERTPFLLTRLLTVLVFAVIVFILCRKVWQEPAGFYEAAFLTLAWFWFLSPTQNPWYWTWALPLVPMARNRAWLLVSGLTLIYYSRFWFEYHTATTQKWGLEYQGVAIFDFVIVWIEFVPFLLLLFWISRLALRAESQDY